MNSVILYPRAASLYASVRVPMALQNRVDPYGTIFRTPARGTLMGNRGGAIHNDRREIVRQCKGQRWIACVLEFKGRSRVVMSPGLYTELFFLDEAVAFAAGHRPCAECRRARFNAFKDAWCRWDQAYTREALRAPAIDAELHRCRIDETGRKVTYQAVLSSLPNGSFVEIDGAAYLVWDDALMLWTPERYAKKIRRPPNAVVTVLTPQPSIECFRHGYQPAAHASAQSI